MLQVTSQRTRSQELNREDAVARFAELLRVALHVEKSRVATKVSRAKKEERLQDKRKRTVIKQSRGKNSQDWD